MKTRTELKAEAKEQIKGNIFIIFVCWAIASVILGGMALIPTVGKLASNIFNPVIMFGFTKIFYDLAQGEKAEISKLFYGFTNFGNVFVTNLLSSIFILLWSLLLLIPGIVKGYSYSMINYILCDNPEMSGTEAINESKRIMDGHKMDLFVLHLSFIPWVLLGCITCGLGFIYVIPYMQATITNFYNDIKAPVDMGI